MRKTADQAEMSARHGLLMQGFAPRVGILANGPDDATIPNGVGLPTTTPRILLDAIHADPPVIAADFEGAVPKFR